MKHKHRWRMYGHSMLSEGSRCEICGKEEGIRPSEWAVVAAFLALTIGVPLLAWFCR
jgi:hypothetical protein